MRAAARVVAAFSGGQTRLSVLKGEAPLLPRRTGPNEVYFVGGAAGPLGGDELRTEIEVGAGATLVVRTVAASIALPGRDGAWSHSVVEASVGAGGRLVWLPEPLIATARCRHSATSTVDLEADASLVWRDELVCGRHGEGPGDIRLSTTVRRAGRPLYRNELAVGPSAPSWAGPAVLGGARVHATLLRVGGPPRDIPPATPSAAVLLLSGDALLATALAADLPSTRRFTDPFA